MRAATSAGQRCPLHEASQVQFHPLFFRPSANDQEVWRVGVEHSALAIELPVEGVTAIHSLQAGRSLAETAALLQQKYGEAIDLLDLVQELAGVGLVAQIDTIPFAPPEQIGQAWLARIAPATVRWLYTPPVLLVWAALVLVGPLLLLFQPAVRPHARDLLWSPSYTLDLLFLLVLGPLLLLKHEAGHLLAARARGLPAELTFGHRLVYLVAVSRIGEIWKLRRCERLVIYCAGMVNDAVVASLCLGLLCAAGAGFFPLPTQLAALLRLIVLTQYLGISWQLQIFLKTDLYHVLADLTGRHDLPEQTSALLAGWRRAVFHRVPKPQDSAVSSDLLTLGYTALSVVGISASFIWVLWYGLPAYLIAFHGEIALIATSIPTQNVPGLLDGLAGLCLQCTWLLLLGWSIVRQHVRTS